MLVHDERDVQKRLREKDSFMLDVIENGEVLYEARQDAQAIRKEMRLSFGLPLV